MDNCLLEYVHVHHEQEGHIIQTSLKSGPYMKSLTVHYSLFIVNVQHNHVVHAYDDLFGMFRQCSFQIVLVPLRLKTIKLDV